MESVGLMMFTKYKVRSQRIIVDAFDENGARAILQYGLQTQLAAGSNVFDSNYAVGSVEFGNLIQEPFSKAGQVIQFNPLLRMAGTALSE